MTYTRAGISVLLIDADLHNPTQAGFFGIANSPGLAEHLEGRETAVIVREASSGAGVAVLPAGTAMLPPSQLLASPEANDIFAKLAASYDVVIIDSPPLLPVADTRSLARIADGTILAVMAGETTAKSVKSALDLLEQVKVTPIGGVLNNAQRHASYYYYGANA